MSRLVHDHPATCLLTQFARSRTPMPNKQEPAFKKSHVVSPLARGPCFISNHARSSKALSHARLASATILLQLAPTRHATVINHASAQFDVPFITSPVCHLHCQLAPTPCRESSLKPRNVANHGQLIAPSSPSITCPIHAAAISLGWQLRKSSPLGYKKPR